MEYSKNELAIINHVTEHGPATVEELCEAIGIKRTAVSVNVVRPIRNKVLVIEKFKRPGAGKLAHRYCLAPKEEKVYEINPADPFGLAAKAKRAEKVDMPKPKAEKPEVQQKPTAKILEWNGITRLDLDPQKVLRKAIDAKPTEVVIIGYDADGNFYFASSKADGPSVLWDLEQAKRMLLSVSVD